MDGQTRVCITETEKVPCLNKVEGKNPLPQLISGLDTSAPIHTHIPKAGRGKRGEEGSGGRKIQIIIKRKKYYDSCRLISLIRLQSKVREIKSKLILSCILKVNRVLFWPRNSQFFPVCRTSCGNADIYGHFMPAVCTLLQASDGNSAPSRVCENDGKTTLKHDTELYSMLLVIWALLLLLPT